MKSSKVVTVSALIKVWNPNSQPVQVAVDGTSVPGMSEGEIDSTDKIAQGALALGLLKILGGVVAPAAESQVADSTEAEAAPDAPAAVEAVIEAEVAEEATDAEDETKTVKSTRTKSQASKES